MPRLTGQQLAKLSHLSRRPTIATDLAACQASDVPADLVAIKSAAAIFSKTRSFFSRRIHAGDFHAWRTGRSAVLVSLSQIAQAIDAQPWHSRPLPVRLAK